VVEPPPTPVLPPPPPPRRRRRSWPWAAGAIALTIALIAALGAVGASKQSHRRDEIRADRALLNHVLPGLRRDAADVRELPYERTVVVRLLPSVEAIPDVFRVLDVGGDPLPSRPVLSALDMIGPLPGSGELSGYYDPGTGVVTIFDNVDLDRPYGRGVVIHELTHALVDQRFDLDLVGRAIVDGDSFLATSSLVEGDAMLAEHLWLERTAPEEPSPFHGYRDPEDGEALFAGFPYVRGYEFVRSLYDAGGWEALNEAYRRPPVTSEQVLHPEAYLAGDSGVPAPEEVMSPAPGLGAQFEDGRVGELFLRGLLGPTAPASASEGWDGGAYHAFRDDEGRVSVHVVLAWDAPSDVGEFVGALGRWAAEAFGGFTDFGPRETGHRYGAGSHCIDMAVDEFHALVTFTVIGHPCDA